jgi:lantibiotic modifying enzyme
MTTKKSWHTILDDNETKPYRRKLSQIGDEVVKHMGDIKADEIGLMGGKAGLALFLFYYAMFTQDDQYADHGVEMLSQIFDAINDGFTYHTHAGGLAGIGWTVEHLARNGFIDIDTNETLEDVDPYLDKAMIYDINNGNFDYLHGAVGNGAYFLTRLKNPRAKEYLKGLIDQMEAVAHRDDDGSFKWLSTLDIEKETKGYNLSMSHGIASIITFLGKVLAAGIHKEKTRELLDGAVKYLLKFKLDRKEFASNFPSWIQEGEPLTASRLAWCYGDLGAGIALYLAAQCAGNKEWEKIAVDTLLDSTSRRGAQENSVLDVGLCHGASGIMHIYNRAYHYTGIDTFKETALYWAEHVLSMATFEDGYAGYKTWRTEKYGGWTPSTGYLEGVSGIGLALIALLSDIDPKWDYSLFIS